MYSFASLLPFLSNNGFIFFAMHTPPYLSISCNRYPAKSNSTKDTTTIIMLRSTSVNHGSANSNPVYTNL